MSKATLGIKNTRSAGTYTVNPADLIIDEAQNGRAFPYTDAQIYERAVTLKQQGQLEPVGIKRVGKDAAIVVYGVGRTLGALYLNQNDPDFAETPFELEVTVVDDDADAFALNVTENFHRLGLSPVDIAHNILKSDERQPAEATEDARNAAALMLFGKEVNNDGRKWLERHRAIGTLSMALRRKIHAKTLAVDAALEYVGLDPDTAEAVHAAAETGAEGRKVTKARVQKAKVAKGVTNTTPTRAAKPEDHRMNRAAFNAFLGYQVENNHKHGVRAICTALLGLIKGDLAEPEVIKVLNNYTIQVPAKDGAVKGAKPAAATDAPAKEAKPATPAKPATKPATKTAAKTAAKTATKTPVKAAAKTAKGTTKK